MAGSMGAGFSSEQAQATTGKLPNDFPLNLVLQELWNGYPKNAVWGQCVLARRVSLVSKDWADKVRSWQNGGESFEHVIGVIPADTFAAHAAFVPSLCCTSCVAAARRENARARTKCVYRHIHRTEFDGHRS